MLSVFSRIYFCLEEFSTFQSAVANEKQSLTAQRNALLSHLNETGTVITQLREKLRERNELLVSLANACDGLREQCRAQLDETSSVWKRLLCVYVCMCMCMCVRVYVYVYMC